MLELHPLHLAWHQPRRIHGHAMVLSGGAPAFLEPVGLMQTQYQFLENPVVPKKD